MERIILHCDLNNFYASCECLLNPSLASIPVAVCGSEEDRHGIVLAKNYHAKKYGVQTAEPVWQAKAKCPELVTVPPHFDVYVRYSNAVKGIYKLYTNKVESFGLDECWLDISGKNVDEAEGVRIANEIRERVKNEVGLTISVGVSFNKVFAKLGSDLKKPDAVTAITRSGFREQIWKLPASDLLGVGRETKKMLDKYFIDTIGKIATAPRDFLERKLGKAGVQLWLYANGEDESPVLCEGEHAPAKSFGHGTTTPKDLTSNEEVRRTILMLTRDIADSLRKSGMKASGVSVNVRDADLVHKSWQCRLPTPTAAANNIASAAYSLFAQSYDWRKNLRSVTVTAINLISDDEPVQTDIFGVPENIESFKKNEKVEECANLIRDRYGEASLVPASFLLEESSRAPHIKHEEAKPFKR